MRCCLLLGLNLALTWKDISLLTDDNLNLEKKTFKARRSKTDIIITGMLWYETVGALKKYKELYPSPTVAIFKPKISLRWNCDKLGKRFKLFKEELPLKKYQKVESITHKHLRKSFITAAKKALCNEENIKLVMGRKLNGVEDYYTYKDAELGMLPKNCTN